MKTEKIGRPTIMTEVTVQKLLSAFSAGASITGACLLARIARSTYYEYCKEHPEFSDEIEQIKDLDTVIARKRIMQAIEEGYDEKQEKAVELAKWVLTKKEPGYNGSPASSNVNYGIQMISLEKATTDQLRRISRGEHAEKVLAEAQA